MKSESGASPKPLPAGPESAGIHDFLYVDRARISALYAQLFPQGILTSVKTTAQQTFSDDSNVGTDMKVFKAESKSTESGMEGIEHLFDPSWSIPLDVLERLKSLSLVQDSIRDAGLGSIVLEECFIRVIDFASMENLWEPSMRTFMASSQSETQTMPPEVVPIIAEILKAMPSAIHAHFLTDSGFLWSSIQASGLTIPVTDLTLKYGGTVSGRWNLLYLVDAWADSGTPPDVSEWTGGPLIDAILTAMHGLRTIMGRPQSWMAITPLMIFRSTAGWNPGSEIRASLRV